jgi:D-alanine-D-alanine ligase-like ATP-grasp enzyme
MPAGERIWLSVDYRPPEHFGVLFPTAHETRRLLREEGYNAVFLSVHEPLEKLRETAGVVFPIEEIYTAGGSPTDPFGLRRALEGLRIPFVGCGSQALSAIADKRWAKEELASGGLEVPRGVLLDAPERSREAVERFLATCGCPAVMKPVSGPGASRGVFFLPGEKELWGRVRSWEEGGAEPVLLEEWIEGPELTAWVLGIEPDVRAVGAFEVNRGGEPILDHDMKIGLRRIRPQTGPRPAPRPEVLDRVREAAVAAHRRLGAYSYSRVDLIVRDGRPVILEVNPHPKILHHPQYGLTTALGRSLGEVMEVLLDHARRRPHEQGGPPTP